MHDEQIREAWNDYLKDLFESPLGGTPFLLEKPHCATCTHWFLINAEGLRNLNKTSSPEECDLIETDMTSGRVRAFYDEGRVVDTFRDHVFYGWCKRYPPTFRTSYSIIGFRSLFTKLSRQIPNRIAGYDFPLMPHSCSCGEWKEDEWVAEFVDEHSTNLRRKK